MSDLHGIQIIEKYPDLFGKPPFDPRKTLIAFGLEIGEGWFPLLEETLDKIRAELQENPIKNFRIIQVKEKFGGLRVNTNYSPEAICEIIDEAERKASKICDVCGKPGKIRVGGWIVTRCDEHVRPRSEDDE